MNQDVIDAPVVATLGAAQQASSGIALQRRGDIVGAGASLQETSGLIQVIAAAARDPSVDIEKMERLWVMHEKLKARADEEAFNAAMNKAQGEMGRVSVDAANQQTRSTYATYGQLEIGRAHV